MRKQLKRRYVKEFENTCQHFDMDDVIQWLNSHPAKKKVLLFFYLVYCDRSIRLKREILSLRESIVRLVCRMLLKLMRKSCV